MDVIGGEPLLLQSLGDLLRQTIETDFAPLYAEMAGETDIPIEAILESDRVYTRGTQEYARSKAGGRTI